MTYLTDSAEDVALMCQNPEPLTLDSDIRLAIINVYSPCRFGDKAQGHLRVALAFTPLFHENQYLR
jgi:hypothetical protein